MNWTTAFAWLAAAVVAVAGLGGLYAFATGTPPTAALVSFLLIVVVVGGLVALGRDDGPRTTYW